jgi:hypothetical protein
MQVAVLKGVPEIRANITKSRINSEWRATRGSLWIIELMSILSLDLRVLRGSAVTTRRW